MPKKNVTVKQDENAPVTVEVLATEIAAISAGIKKLRAGRLNDRALILLIVNASPQVGGWFRSKAMSVGAVKAVLEGLESLEATYLKKAVR